MTVTYIHDVRYRVFQFFAALKANLSGWAGARLTAADEVLVTSILTTPAQQQLFGRMSPNDQRHALAVARTLQQAGYHQPELLQAALLHDVAKSMGQPLIHRVLIVLLKAFWPALLERISESANKRMANERMMNKRMANKRMANKRMANKRMANERMMNKRMANDESGSYSLFAIRHSSFPAWRRPFVIHAHHPAIGAAWAEEAACEPLAVRLIARHQETLTGEPVEDEEKLLAALQWADNLN